MEAPDESKPKAQAGPYRSSNVLEGVALPRRNLRAWTFGVVCAASLSVPLCWGMLQSLSLRPEERDWNVAYAVAAVWMIILGLIGVRLVRARSTRPGALVALMIVPALVTELACVLDRETIQRLAEGTEHRAPRVLDLNALYRIGGYTFAAVAALTAAVACLGAVFGIDYARIAAMNAPDRDSAKADGSADEKALGGAKRLREVAIPIATSLVFVIVFLVLRVRSVHRDGLGGMLGAVAMVAAGVLGALLVERVRRLRAWHADEEASAVERAAACAVISILACGLFIERVALALDEHRGLIGLFHMIGGFESRFISAQAIASAWSAHRLALAILLASALPVLVVLKLASKHRWLRSDDGVAAMIFLVGLIGLSEHATMRERSTLVPAPEFAGVLGKNLPLAPSIAPVRPSGPFLTLGANGYEPRPSGNPLTDPTPLIAIERDEETIGPLLALEDLKCDVNLLVTCVEPAKYEDLGLARALVGPRTAMVQVAVVKNVFNSPEYLTPPIVLVVIDDGGVGRFVQVMRREPGGLETIGTVHGVKFSRTREAYEERMKNRFSSYATVIVLAPSTRNNGQELIDTIAASSDLSPDRRILITLDRGRAEQIVTGRTITP